MSRWGQELDILLSPTMAIEPPVAGEVLAAADASASGGGPALQFSRWPCWRAGST